MKDNIFVIRFDIFIPIAQSYVYEKTSRSAQFA